MATPTAEAAPAVATSGGAPPGRRRPLGPVRRFVRELGLTFITLGMIVLLFVGYQLWATGIAERHSQATLAKAFNAAIASKAPTGQGAAGKGATSSGGGDNPTVGASTQPAKQSPAIGGALDHLVIPKIKLSAFVVQGVAEGDLEQGPGHYPQTVLPGQDGNAAIAGHRTTYGAPFYELNELATGDDIYLTDTAGRTFVYQVVHQEVVSPSDVAVLSPTSFAELTLTTCNPRYSATSRLVVVSRLTGQPPLPVTHVPTKASTTPAVPKVQGASAPPATATATDNLGHGNRGAWPPAIAYGAAVVLLWVGARLLINRKRRWARLAAYIGGIAVCLVPLWFCFENVVRLLPPNI
jgi:sortase A